MTDPDYGPLIRVFARWPVKTVDAGWCWLIHVNRRRIQEDVTRPLWAGDWQYWRYKKADRS